MIRRHITLSAIAIIAASFAAHAQNAPAPAPAGAPAAAAMNGAHMDTVITAARMEIASARKQTVAANMNFIDAEATAFWPIYDAYRAEMYKAKDSEWEVIKTYAMNQKTPTDSMAMRLVNQWLASRKSQADVRASYTAKFAKAIGWIKTARFFQVDNKIDLIVDSSHSAGIPLVSAK